VEYAKQFKLSLISTQCKQSTSPNLQLQVIVLGTRFLASCRLCVCAWRGGVGGVSMIYCITTYCHKLVECRTPLGKPQHNISKHMRRLVAPKWLSGQVEVDTHTALNNTLFAQQHRRQDTWTAEGIHNSRRMPWGLNTKYKLLLPWSHFYCCPSPAELPLAKSH